MNFSVRGRRDGRNQVEEWGGGGKGTGAAGNGEWESEWLACVLRADDYVGCACA